MGINTVKVSFLYKKQNVSHFCKPPLCTPCIKKPCFVSHRFECFYFVSPAKRSLATFTARVPFRYRSYYYDRETKLYDLNTRYYNPETGRFINADSLSNLGDLKSVLGGLNLFSYCDNNPVMDSDENGNLPKWLKTVMKAVAVVVVAVVVAVVSATCGAAAPILAAGVIGAGAEVFSQTVLDNKSFSQIEWKDVAISGAASMVSAAIPGSGVAVMAGRAVATSVVENVGRAVLKGNDLKVTNIIINADSNFLLDFGSSKISKGISKFADKKIGGWYHGYSSCQGGLRKKGFDYTREEVYEYMKKDVLKKETVNKHSGYVLDFLTGLIPTI